MQQKNKEEKAMQETKVLKMTPGEQKIEALQKMVDRNDERFNKLRKKLQKKLSLAEREKLEKKMYLQVRMKERRQRKIEKLKEQI